MTRSIRVRLQLLALEDRTVPAPIASQQIDHAIWLSSNPALVKIIADPVADQPPTVGAGGFTPTPTPTAPPSTSAAPASSWFDRAIGDQGLRTLAVSLARDGMLDRSDWMDLLTYASRDGVISTSDLDDLNDLFRPIRVFGSAANLPQYVIPDFIASLASAIIDGDPANASYQGVALGNLHAGTTSTQVQMLINKWFLGKDLPTASGTYRTVSGSLFQNGPSYSDVDQGAVGDCYFVAALAELAQRSPQAVRDMFYDNRDGTYIVRMFVNGNAKYIVVNSMLAVGSDGRAVYASFGGTYSNSSNELWVALLEKAYAQLNASGGIGQDGTNRYAGIDGGYGDQALKNLTGGNAGWTWMSYANGAQLAAAAVANTPTILASKQVNAGNGVVDGHAYALVGYDAATQKYVLYNPWGSTIRLTWQQILTSFNGYWQSI